MSDSDEFDWESLFDRPTQEYIKLEDSELAYDFFELAQATELGRENLLACIIMAGVTASEIEQNPGATLLVKDELYEKEISVSNYEYQPLLRREGEAIADMEIILTPEATVAVRDVALEWDVPPTKVVEQFLIFGIQYYRSTLFNDKDYLIVDDQGRRSRLIL